MTDRFPDDAFDLDYAIQAHRELQRDWDKPTTLRLYVQQWTERGFVGERQCVHIFNVTHGEVGDLMNRLREVYADTCHPEKPESVVDGEDWLVQLADEDDDVLKYIYVSIKED